MAKRAGIFRRLRGRRGFALLMVMMIVVVMAVLTSTLVMVVSREVRQTANVRDYLRASYLAEMALIRGQVVLRLDEHPEYDSLNEIWAKPLTWEGETFGEEEYGGGGSGGAVSPPQVMIVDEERKFNILTLVRGNREQQEMAAEVLKRLIEICRRQDPRLELDGQTRRVRRLGDDSTNPETLVRNLIRYLEERPVDDTDRLEFDAGPEDSYDQRRMRKQSPFEMLTMSELLLAEGWNRDLLYGPPRVAESEFEERDPYADPYAERDRQLTPEEEFENRRRAVESVDERSRDPNPIGLMPFITLYSTGRININTAPREVLLALDPDITWETVDRIIIAREQDRRDILEEEETGQIPGQQDPFGEEEEAEEEDNASFRPQDLASFAAFVNRVNNDMPEEGTQTDVPTLEGFLEDFTEEIYNNIRPWLGVTSTVFTVEASATIERERGDGRTDRITHTIKAVYRRSNVTPQQPQPEPTGEEATQPTASQPQDMPEFPPEPEIRLTLLFRDVVSGG
jgi:type II secretory pathway component PulK